jgi:hypothetical protein
MPNACLIPQEAQLAPVPLHVQRAAQSSTRNLPQHVVAVYPALARHNLSEGFHKSAPAAVTKEISASVKRRGSEV